MNNWKDLLSLFKGEDKKNSFAGHPTNNFIDGRIYLRKMKLDGKILKRYHVEKGDFTGTSFYDCWIEDCVFEGAYFEKTNFTEMTDHGNVFIDCDFIGCKFNNAVLGYKGTKFINCRFTNCNFTRTLFIRGEFVGAVFINCKMKGLDFKGSSFEKCSFEGELNDCWFRGGFPSQMDVKSFGVSKVNTMYNVSFEKAELFDLAFSDRCDLSTVKVMEAEKYIKFDNWLKRLNYLKKISLDLVGKEKEEISIFIQVYHSQALNQDWYILNTDDIKKSFGGEIIGAKIIKALLEYK